MHDWRTRLPSLILLFFLFVADLSCSLLTALSVHSWSWANLGAAWGKGGLTDFSGDALDGLLLAAFRLVALLGLGFAAVRLGTPAHEQAADDRRRILREREELRDKWKQERQGLSDHGGSLTHGDEEQRAGLVKTSAAAVLPSGKSCSSTSSSASSMLKQPLLNVQERSDADGLHSIAAPMENEMSWSPSAASASAANGASVNGTTSASAAAAAVEEEAEEEAFERSLPVLPPEVKLTDPEKLQLSRRASLYRRVFVSLLFGVATLLQAYLGVKLVGFHFSSEWVQGLLMAATIICINAEQSVLRHIVAHLTQEEGYLLLSLHPHRIHYDEAPGHWSVQQPRLWFPHFLERHAALRGSLCFPSF
jgi:hypothetical protein